MNISCHLLGSAIVLAAAATARAQEEPVPVQPATPAPVFKPLDTLLHAPVLLAAKRDEAEAEEAAVAASDRVGMLADLVVDTLSHRITFAAVQTEDSMRAVPFMSLTWDAAQGAWILAGGKSVLANAKPLEPWRLDELHGAAAAAPAKDEGRQGEQQDTSATRDGETGKASAATSGRFVLASECAKREVAADDDVFATAVGMVIETNSGAPAFLRVAAGGGDVAIPFPALKVRKGTAAGEPDRFSLAMRKARAESAPRLDKDPKATLDDREFRVKLYEYFGIVTPAFDNSSRALLRK